MLACHLAVVYLDTAHAGDLGAVIRIAKTTLTEHYDDALFFTMLDLAGDTFLVARSEGDNAVMGFALAVRQTPYEARLIVIAVDPLFQGQNVGRRLLSEVEKRLLRRGVMSITLEVRENNMGAISFYRRAGYDIGQSVPRYYSDGGRAIMMRKGL